MVNVWTRDDLPAVMDLVKASADAVSADPSGGADAALDAVVEHLNANHPKPSGDVYSTVLSLAGHVHDLKADLADMERERDAAVERAEQAEREAEQ